MHVHLAKAGENTLPLFISHHQRDTLSGRFFWMQGSLGTIKDDKIAELVMLDADPLKDISNTRKITAVIVNG